LASARAIPDAAPEEDRALISLALGTAAKVEDHMDRFEFNRALEAIWELVSRSNKYIDETEPWVLAKGEDGRERLGRVLYNISEALRVVSVLIQPYLVRSSTKIREQLGLGGETLRWEDAQIFGAVNTFRTSKGENLFPRIDIEKELAAIAEG
jgi:methionyl-tRNA synthetase